MLSVPTMRGGGWTSALLLLVAWAMPASCSAAGPFDASSPFLLGDWNGRRQAWADDGVQLDFGHVSETAHNFAGGDAKLTRYTEQWTLGATLDLERRFGWTGTGLRVVFSDRNGRDLGADAHIGNSLLLQEVYGRGQTWWLSTLAYRQSWLDGRVDWSLGKMPVGSDFAAFSCDFQNLTFCGAQPGNLVGDYWLNWPVSPWATRLQLDAGNGVQWRIGAYQVDAKYVDEKWARRNAWKPYVPGGTDGWLVPLEVGWTPRPGGLPGSYKVGAWRSSAGAPDLRGSAMAVETQATPRMRDSRYGMYVNVEQKLTGGSESAGLSVFLNASQADRSTSRTDRQIAAGLRYRGLPGRPDDVVGLALGATHHNARYYDAFLRRNGSDWQTESRAHVGRGEEYVCELMYDWMPLRSVRLRPNLQYIHHPGGTSANDDAVILGLKTSIAF